MEEDVFEPRPSKDQSFFDRPGMRSAFLQAGLQMLMPTAPGTSPIGNVASAIGSGGEAYRRALGTDIAERRQAQSEFETSRRAKGGGSGGLTLSQRMKAQKDQRKEWDDWLESEAEALAESDPNFVGDTNKALEFLTDDANKENTIKKFKKRQSLAAEATGQTQLMSSAQLMQDAAPQLAELRHRLAAGDPKAQAYVSRLKTQLADPEVLDAYLGGAE